jgi:hypothetical protein
MDFMLCDLFGDLAEGHLIALTVHSDNGRSLHKHHKVGMNSCEENHNYLKEVRVIMLYSWLRHRCKPCTKDAFKRSSRTGTWLLPE